MPKEIALKGRPNRIGYDVYRYIVIVFDAPVPFPVHAVFSVKDRWLFLHCEEIRIETASSRFRRTFFSGNNARHSAAPSGRCSRGCLPRAEAHGLFCFRPLGDTKCPNSRQHPSRLLWTNGALEETLVPRNCVIPIEGI